MIGIKAVRPCGGSAAAKTPSHLGSARSMHARDSSIIIVVFIPYAATQQPQSNRAIFSGCGVSSDRARLADAVRSVGFLGFVLAPTGRDDSVSGKHMAVHVPDDSTGSNIAPCLSACTS